MLATLLKSPYTISFAGNPLPFIYQVSPYGAAQRTQDISLTFRVWVERAAGSGIFDEVYVQKLYPTDDGKVEIDVSTIIDPYLEFYTPRPDLAIPVNCDAQRRRYKATAILQNGNAQVGSEVTSPVLHAIKGGLANEAWHYKEFFTKIIQEQKKPLLFSAAKELTDPEALKYFYWVYPFADGKIQQATYKIYLSDGTNVTTTNENTIFSPQWGVCCAPSGFNQCGLDQLIASDKYPVKYSIKIFTGEVTAGATTDGLSETEVQNGGSYFSESIYGIYTNVAVTGKTAGTGAKATIQFEAGVITSVTITTPGNNYVEGDDLYLFNNNPGSGGTYYLKVTAVADSAGTDTRTTIVDEYFFNLDNRNFYDKYFLLYRNSIGGMETVRLLGQVDLSADYARQQARRTLPPVWFSQLKNEITEETFTHTADTGFMSKEELMKLRDLFLSKQVHQVERVPSPQGEGVGVRPIVLVSSKAKFFSNRDNLVSTQIEWQLAAVNTHYTPGALMPATRTCPALEKFFATQLNKATLQFQWSLEDPYDLLEVQVIIGDDTYTYTYEGNTGMILQSFDNPAVDDPVDITIKARTICNPDAVPVEYGAFSTIILSVIPNSLPVAVPDYFTVPIGFNGALPVSVLANDYDPDGDLIEAVAEWGLFGNGSSPAVFQVDAAGMIIISNGTIDMTGSQSFDYHIKETGGTDIVTGKVYVNFGNGPQAIYIKVVQRNVTEQSNPFQTVRTGEVWLDFFSDPACTVPIDLTAYGMIINAKLTGHAKKYFNSTTIYDNVINYAPYSVGTKVKIYTGELYYHAYDTWHDEKWKTYTFTVEPGTGYTPVNP